MTKPVIEQALPVPQTLTSPHRKAVLADGEITKPAIKQALPVPQTLTSPRRQAGPCGRRGEQTDDETSIVRTAKAHTSPHRKVAPPQGAPHI